MNNKKILGDELKKEFPLLCNSNIIYADNAATTQKPQCVIDAMNSFYTTYNSNVHRGIHFLSEKATDEFEIARSKVGKFINSKPSEIVFTYGTTHALNTVAFGIKHKLTKNDEIVISEMEHHANIVPWQEVCKQTGASLVILPITNDGEIDEIEMKKLISDKTKILSLSHTSNVLGTRNDVKKIIEFVKSISPNCFTIIDGAQEIAHSKIDVKDIGCDAYTFSAHKLFGPTGVGALYLKEEFMDVLQPFMFGGSMIKDVSFEKSSYTKGFQKFEAGTPAISAVIGFAEAVDFLSSFNFEDIEKHENDLVNYFFEKSVVLGDDFIVYGPKRDRSPVFSFTFGSIHPQDLSAFLNEYSIATRSGHHCAIPLHKKLNLSGTCRISLSFYNSRSDIDLIIDALSEIKKIFSK